MKSFDKEYDSMMNIDDMKSAKEGWQSWSRTGKRILKRVQAIEVTKANRWELKSLEASYEFLIDGMDRIIYYYREMINLAENCELEPYVYKKVVKELQIIGKGLRQESEKKSFKELNNKYVHGIREAKVITSL